MMRLFLYAMWGIVLLGCDSRGIAGANCTKTSQCRDGLFCISGQCASNCTSDGCGVGLRSCETATDCFAGESCTDNACVRFCGVDTDCDLGSVCLDGLCRAGCRADNECAADQICKAKACALGCRNDAACGTGKMCLDEQCTQAQSAWLPTVTFSPPSVTIYAGEPAPPVTFTVGRGMHDTADPAVTIPSLDSKITVSGNTATLNDTNLGGNYSFTVSAQGRAGAQVVTFTFNVITDNLYAYIVPAGGATGGMTVVRSDGTGLDTLEDGSKVSNGSVFGMAYQAGSAVAYPVTDADWRNFGLHTATKDGVVGNWLETQGTFEFTGERRATCALGDGRSTSDAAAVGSTVCGYPIHQLTSSADGRYVALLVTKAQATENSGPASGCAEILEQTIGDTLGHLFVLAGVRSAPGVVVIVDTAQTPPGTPLVTGAGTQVAPDPTRQVLGAFSENAGTAPLPWPAKQYHVPAISADGSTFAVIESTLPACPGGGCGPERECNANGVCVPKKCMVDDDCGTGNACSVCENKGSGDCPAGTIGGTGYLVGGPDNVARCCGTAGGLCVPEPCGAADHAGTCEADQTCIELADQSFCATVPAYALKVFDRASMSPIFSSPITASDVAFDGTISPSIIQARMVGNDRLVYVQVLGLKSAYPLLAGTGPTGPVTHMTEVHLTGSGLDTTMDRLVLPRDTATTAEGNFGQASELKDINEARSSVIGCLAATGDPTARADCVNDCRSAVISAFDNINSWCVDAVTSGHSVLAGSTPQYVLPNDAGTRILATMQAYRFPVGSTGDCVSANFADGVCGVAGATNAPQTSGGSVAGLILHDVAADTNVNVLDSPGFAPFIDNPTGEIVFYAPKFLAEGRQVGFFARGTMLVGDGPQAFVVNVDGSNPHRILDQNQLADVKGVGSCAGADVLGAGLLALVVLIGRRSWRRSPSLKS